MIAPGVSVVGMMRSLIDATSMRCSGVKSACEAVRPDAAVSAAKALASGATSSAPNNALAPVSRPRRSKNDMPSSSSAPLHKQGQAHVNRGSGNLLCLAFLGLFLRQQCDGG